MAIRPALACALALAALTVPAAAQAHHVELPSETEGALSDAGVSSHPTGGESEHSDNMRLIANFDDGGAYRQGSDIAFEGNLAVLGNYSNPGGFRLMDISDPSAPEELGQFVCPGSQADVSIFGDLVFVSVDATMASEECGSRGASTAAVAAGDHWEGVRVVSIADRSNPQQIAAVDTDCGSHTHTLVPDEANKRVLIYALSYPISGQGRECNAGSHRKISVIEVPLAEPEAASVVSTPDVSPAVGCHDVTVFTELDLAAAACLTESQMWDISDPANPEVISHIVNPAINIHHSATFAWDGTKIVIGDELGGAAVTPGCVGPHHAPIGSLWFYDVSDPRSPQLQGSWRIPREVPSIFCTAHNFNVVPLRSDRDILVSAWYNGGTTVLDFTDPSSPEELGHYIAREPTQNREENVISAAWSSYWYNGHIFANNFDEDVNSLSAKSRGLDVFEIDHPELTPGNAARLQRLNPQTQEPFPGIPARGR